MLIRSSPIESSTASRAKADRWNRSAFSALSPLPNKPTGGISDVEREPARTA
jgi:hypothetical protein